MPLASTMKYMAGLCSKTSRHCRSLPSNSCAARLQGASPLHLRYLLSAVADIEANSLAARLPRRDPAECAGTSINTRRQGRSLLFRDSILPSDLGQRLSKSAENCRKRKKYVAGTAQASRLAQRRPALHKDL